MPPLLVVPHPPDVGAARDLPDLPALSTLIRLGEATPQAEDWRSGLIEDLGAVVPGAAPAQIAAQGLPLPPGTAVCLASPVHAVAGLSRVHLHEAGILLLDAADRAAFAAGFAAQFGEMRLHAVAEGWVLEAPWAASADDGDPVEQLGAPLARLPAADTQRRALRRTGAEIEMWLAGLDWNQSRARRGELPVNLLWVWGGGTVLPRPATSDKQAFNVHAAAVEPWLAGLAVLGGRPLLPLPSGWDAPPAASVMVLHPVAAIDAHPWQEWERCWFAPALNDLRERRIDTLMLRLGRQSWRIRRSFWRRALRRSRPWWQALET